MSEDVELKEHHKVAARMLLEGARVPQVAVALGLTPNAIYNLMQRAHFKTYYNKLLGQVELVVVNAHKRILQTQDVAVDTVLGIMQSECADDNVKLNAAKDWLDRGANAVGLKGGESSGERPPTGAFEHVLGVLRELNGGVEATLSFSAKRSDGERVERTSREDERDVQDQLVLPLQGCVGV